MSENLNINQYDPANPIVGWFDYGSALYERDRFTVGARTSMQISMAKNEKEGFQYILTADRDYADLRCTVSALSDGNGNVLSAKVFWAWYTHTTKWKEGYWPDALVEQGAPGYGIYGDQVRSVQKGQARTVYIQVSTTPDTPAGEYRGVLTLYCGDEPVCGGEVGVTVWNITYSEKTACTTAFGNHYNENGYEFTPSYDMKAYYDFMLVNRISLYHLPYDVLDERADAYLNNPRVTSFLATPIGSQINSHAEAVYKKLSQNPEWLDRAYLYPIDEPRDEAALDRVREFAEKIRSCLPGGRMMTPINTLWINEISMVDFFADITTIHCPLADFIGDGDDRDRYRALQARGDTVWWYVCGAQGGGIDSTDLLAVTAGTKKRILFWQQYQYKIDGLLYWGTSYWQASGNIWEGTPATASFHDTDGVICYWRPEDGAPVGSLGLEAVRDGIEDYQLLTMAKELLGDEEVMAYTYRLSSHLYSCVDDAETLMQVRAELAGKIEEAMK